MLQNSGCLTNLKTYMDALEYYEDLVVNDLALFLDDCNYYWCTMNDLSVFFWMIVTIIGVQ